MNRRARPGILFAIALGVSAVAYAQIILQPTPPPIATAGNEPWYLNGEPITHEGSIYYPAGPQAHFNGNEMVRSGFYRGIPLYARTTLEPFSVVFVPLPGGLMQPYQRRRAGEIAGTAGSTVSPLPIEIAAENRGAAAQARMILQAPAPPTNVGPAVAIPGAAQTIVAPVTGTPPPGARLAPRAASANEIVGTSGRVFTTPRPRLVPPGEQPSGINSIFIQFGSARWYPRGGPVPFDAGEFARIGDYHGFPVYTRAGEGDVIYVPMTSEIRTLVVPYSTRRERWR